MSRVTINDIARRAGVSKGAVSYALNGRPGVSEKTRTKILDVAHELGWAPNRTARMLSGSRTETFGLVLARDPRTLGSEPFYMEFVAGLQSELSQRGYALLLQLTSTSADELELYPRWWSEQRVDAVVVVDIHVCDPRVRALSDLGVPAVFVGDPAVTGGFTTVWTDDATAMRTALHRLVELGHRRFGRVAGTPGLSHTQVRDLAFRDALAAEGLTGTIMHADFTDAAGGHATRSLWSQPQPPTAIVFDNDLMAIAGLSALSELGVSVPHDVSLLAWDDSALCTITHPKLSALSHDVMAFGAHVGRRVFDLLEGAEPAAHLDSTPVLVERESTAPAPR
ncbi:MAG TPA: LacI family DNA-binding transcriptional regulator [Microlunatus sp.]|jgi:DNA-binding LacI/PurR family transcriptional regulator|nr:LacI family DNA-binding transcriptional regulator [Microlunatus sp.]